MNPESRMQKMKAAEPSAFEIKGKWDEAFEKYQLLDEELNKRVESYQVPEVFMATAKKINTESGQVGLSLENGRN